MLRHLYIVAEKTDEWLSREGGYISSCPGKAHQGLRCVPVPYLPGDRSAGTYHSPPRNGFSLFSRPTVLTGVSP